MAAVALVSDLVSQSQLAGASVRAGVHVDFANGTDELLSRVGSTRPVLIILDLAHAALEPATIVGRLKELAPDAKILAFGPHVHRQRLENAIQAGCDVVMSRGAFHAQMDDLLGRLAK
jgi:DNA-binding NarL/FixJ family response regulator